MSRLDFKSLVPPSRNTEHAYKMGMDCAINGANDENCHFSVFSTPENTKAWERGKIDGGIKDGR